MKNVLIFLFALLPILFSGCAKHYAFNEENIGLQKNNFYSKVESQSVCILKSSNMLVRNSGDNPTHVFQTMNLDANNVATNVAAKNFEQYFSKVNIVNDISNCNGLSFKVNVTDFHFAFQNLTGSGSIKYDITLNVFFKEKNIMNKTYNIEDTDHIIMRVGNGFKKPSDYIDELFHKSLFNLFETQIKQDIINAL